MADENTEVSVAIYQEVCRSYHAVDDFRAKLLGFLPLASGGAFLLLGDALLDSQKRLVVEKYLGGIGAFGFLVTLGLFIYELRGIQRCGTLIKLGKTLEDSLGIVGQFKFRPGDVGFTLIPSFLGINLSVTLAARLIYSTVLAAWVFFGFGGSLFGVWAAGAVLFISFIGFQLINLAIGKRLEVLDKNRHDKFCS